MKDNKKTLEELKKMYPLIPVHCLPISKGKSKSKTPKKGGSKSKRKKNFRSVYEIEDNLLKINNKSSL